MAGLGAIVIASGGDRGTASAVALVVGIAALALGLVAWAAAQGAERAATGAAFCGPAPVLVFVAAIGLTLAAGFTLDALGAIPTGPPGVLVSVLLSAASSVGLVALLVVVPGALSWREMGFRRADPGEGSALSDAAAGVLLAVPTLLVASVLAAFLSLALGVQPAATIAPTQDPIGILVYLLTAAVITPLWEELFFRGYATTAWARSAGPRGAVVRGAVFFALAHVVTLSAGDADAAVQTAIITVAVRLPVGLVLGWVFLRRRTLAAPMALHATYNAIPILLMALGTGSPAT